MLARIAALKAEGTEVSLWVARPKPRRRSTLSEAVQRASAHALNDWLAQRERPSQELQAKQARLLKVLAKTALHWKFGRDPWASARISRVHYCSDCSRPDRRQCGVGVSPGDRKFRPGVFPRRPEPAMICHSARAVAFPNSGRSAIVERRRRPVGTSAVNREATRTVEMLLGLAQDQPEQR